MQDYKHLREPKPETAHPTLLELLAAGLIIGVFGMWVLHCLFIVASGG